MKRLVLSLTLFLSYALPASAELGANCSPKDNSCSPTEYCKYDDDNPCGSTGKPGKCLKRPEMCTMLLLPVCGCDNKDYGNACIANGNGTSAAHLGTCNSKSSGTTVRDCGLEPQILHCGIKNGEAKEYSTRCAAEKDGATNIAPKQSQQCPVLK